MAYEPFRTREEAMPYVRPLSTGAPRAAGAGVRPRAEPTRRAAPRSKRECPPDAAGTGAARRARARDLALGPCGAVGQGRAGGAHQRARRRPRREAELPPRLPLPSLPHPRLVLLREAN